MRIALLADPHLHPTGTGPAFGHASGPGLGGQPLLRSLFDTRKSTRVFNESGPALGEALRQMAAEGVNLCLIAGDLSDDGQPASWAAVAQLLGEHGRRHGIRFLACPGNHDQWALAGKPLTKQFVDAQGQTTALSGAAGAGQDAVDCPGMRMVGYAEMLSHAGALGFLPQAGDLLWETPFGRAPGLAARMAPVTSPEGISAEVPDLSYLVEPLPGLWVLALDANTYLPDGAGGFRDCGQQGWSAALRHKPWLLPWITAVAGRARAQGKRLLAMSHFPMLDLFGGTTVRLDALDAPRAGRRRMPTPAEEEALAATGLGLHLSGHWHVDAAVARGGLVNLALPSTVGFPAGWKLLELQPEGMRLHDRPLGLVPGFDVAGAAYRAEAGRTGQPEDLGTAPDYDAFLSRHFRNLVFQRRLPEDWPPGMAALLAQPLAALPGLEGAGPLPAALATLPLSELFLDWYLLRESGGGDAAGVSAERRALYAGLPARAEASTPLLRTFFQTLALHAAGADRARAALAQLAGASAGATSSPKVS